MRKETRLTIRPCSHWVYGSGILFCKDQFFKVVDLPEGTRKCFLVATSSVGPDSYEIKSPYRELRRSGAVSLSGLTRIGNRHLLRTTKRNLAKLYFRGYRAVHIEYIEQE
jgi:hypothetical protein